MQNASPHDHQNGCTMMLSSLSKDAHYQSSVIAKNGITSFQVRLQTIKMVRSKCKILQNCKDSISKNLVSETKEMPLAENTLGSF